MPVRTSRTESTRMNEALQAVLDYVRTPQTDHALLITGPWGSGKTYFWKNVVEPQLRQLKSNGDAWRPLYASLYGCESTKNIDTQLFLGSYPRLRNKWTSRLSQVGGNTFRQFAKAFASFELPAIDLRWLVRTNHAVFCFDDLERTRLPMKEAFGYINTFVEHERAKVVIMSNEDAINDEDDKKAYGAMKEKVVGASMAFRTDMDAVFKTLIEEYCSRDVYHRFLSANGELLRQLFDRSETRNIRSLRRALSALAFIFDALESAKVDPNALANQLIYAVAPTSFELHGRGADAAEMRKIHDRQHMAAATFVSAISRPSTRDELTEEVKFAKRYVPDLELTEWGNAVGCPPICEFLLTGILDRVALVSWATELTKPADEKEERFNRLLSDPIVMEDEEFTRTVAEVLGEVESGAITVPGKYLAFYQSFESFAGANLISLSPQQVLEKFVSGLSEARDAGRIQFQPDLRHGINHPSLAPRTEEGKLLRDRVLEANNDALERTITERFRTLRSSLHEDPQNLVRALTDRGDGGFLLTPVFQHFGGEEIAKWIVNLPNALKISLDSALHERYQNNVSSPEFVVELPVLQRITELLKADVEASDSERDHLQMSRFIIKKIARRLDCVIEQLRQLQPKKGVSSFKSADDQPRVEQGDNGDAAME